MIHIDQKEYLAVLEQLLNVTSPSGNTESIIQLMEKYLQEANIPTYKNNKGGLIATIPGKITDKQRMLTAHVDTLGAMVKEIKPNGRLRLVRHIQEPSFFTKPLFMCIKKLKLLSVIKPIWKFA